MSKKADLLLHPIRMRIIQTLHSYKQMTTKHLQEVLTDVPQATLYRQLKTLLDAELIYIVESKQIRGAKEKVYALNQDNLKVPDEEIEQVSAEEFIRHFMAYQSNLLKELERYVTLNDAKNYKNDGLGFGQVHLHLTDQELKQFGQEISKIVQEYASLEPCKERTPVTLGTVTIPQKYREDY